MAAAKLAHYSIRTKDLEASRRFYLEVMNFRIGYRPPFEFPGLWLYVDDDESEYGVVHLIGVDADSEKSLTGYLGDRQGVGLMGTGSVDHLAFLTTDWPSMRERCKVHGVSYVERTIPLLGLHQVFLIDPSGLTIELNYPSAEAPG
jgi:catechol 2,3-dioxygenase-like lactoylglutathione lyase family enzyme